MENTMNTNGGALDWNDVIEKESEFELLPDGVYDFTIESFERGWKEPSEKMGGCHKAHLTIVVKDPINGNTGKVFDDLFLHEKFEWKLSQFFTSIGLKKKGEKLNMDWNRVPGATGRLELKINKYTRKDGTEGSNNRVDKYLPKEQAVFTPGTF